MFVIAALFALGSMPLQAAHIIGGVITYECLGGGNYRFTMKIYRDCFGGGAPFDSAPGSPLEGTVTVFKGNSSVPIKTLDLGSPDITNILPNISNPCLTAPPNVCVEEGVYEFQLNLPTTNESYHIVYQRCCRNNSITNLINPGETGATYSVELLPAAQTACNNSPTFNDFPPVAICTGEPIDFDHSANSNDPGEVLVYSLCSPFDGGGTDQTNATAPNGVAPDPDLPPPFQNVNFLPPYNFLSPLSANPALTIDPNTGFLTGVPNVVGQFVVGVCVEEYRNGELMSITRRDFQFNVAQCDPTVVADIREDDIVTLQGEEYYVVNICGPQVVEFDNQSFQQQNINSFNWGFNINGVDTVLNVWDAKLLFPDTGTYYGHLMVNPGLTCGDTVLIQVNVFPGIMVDFDYVYDTCKAGPVTFTDLSSSGAGPGSIVSWDWNFGDGKSSNDQHPLHVYQVPGELEVMLLVKDTNDCAGIKNATIPYYPVPEYLVVAPSEFIGCHPANIFFDNLSYPVNEAYSVLWDFGDGDTSTAISPYHIYDEIGTFTVSLSIVSPLGCAIDTIWEDLITVLPSPTAGFTYFPEQLSNLQPTASFTDESIDAVKWKWSFGTTGISIDQNPVYTFPDTGVQAIVQVVFHQSGCTDTMIQYLDIIPEVRYFLPNAFTPNADGTNDGFRGNGSLEGATDFHLSIWNRYGERLFETTDPDEAWNGKKDNNGQLAPQGVYIVMVTFTGPRGQPFTYKGYATLVK